MSIFLKNATYIDWQTLEFKKTNIQVEEGNNIPLRFFTTLPDLLPDDVEIDCDGLLVTKSFANAHHHIYSALSRGMPMPSAPPRNFYEKLKYVWWQLDKNLDPDMIRASALYAGMMSLKAGVTFVVDHHASPFAIAGSLDTIAEAFDRLGLSHLLCYEITDRDGMNKASEGMAHTAEYLARRQGLVGLHASFTVSDQTMRGAAEMVEKFKSGVHIHVAEDKYDQEHCQINYKKQVIGRLSEFGFLRSAKSILVHCLHLSAAEKKAVANSEAWVAENMESNLNNKVGVFNAKNMGERVMLGTDGMHSNMIRSAQWAYFNGLTTDRSAPQDVYKRLRNVHYYLKQNKFSGDGDNNLVVLDYDSPSPVTPDNFIGHFFYGLDATHVKHVIANGKLAVKNRKLTGMDEEEILAFAREMAAKLWAKMKQ
jgi:cytosine/adenosine deaminase-related metal-dependent hydrolase